ncbi:lipid-A-disaccharide synthase [soil metagenome]
MTKSLYFIAGEASGDTHGAALMAALRQLDPDVQLHGRGGPRMREIAGSAFIDWSDHSAVLGLWEVLKQYGYFRREFAATIAQIRTTTPDAVVLIDYPGFNLRLARALRSQFPQLKIIYYISPQVWAWNRRRIPQMARYLDLMLCIFPFEAELYNQSGLRSVFVGHPMMEHLEARRITTARDPNLVALLPGSRAREIRKILPPMLAAAEQIRAGQPGTRFEIAAASPARGEQITRVLRSSCLPAESVQITVEDSAGAMQRAAAGMVASGTATLEAAYFRLPFVLVYRVAWMTYIAAKLVVKVPHIGMPNVLAGREIVPEFIQHQAQPQPIARAVLRLLREPAAREQLVREFNEIISMLGAGGASTAAARAILNG